MERYKLLLAVRDFESNPDAIPALSLEEWHAKLVESLGREFPVNGTKDTLKAVGIIPISKRSNGLGGAGRSRARANRKRLEELAVSVKLLYQYLILDELSDDDAHELLPKQTRILEDIIKHRGTRP
jgi:hypothetical protein